MNVAIPQFDAPEAGKKPITFKATLLNVCQGEFEAIHTSDGVDLTEEEKEGKDSEEINHMIKKKKDRCLATMKFIGHLFLRQLLKDKIIGSVVTDLAMCQEAEKTPPEHLVECICELLNAIGFTLEQAAAGKQALEQVCGRLMDLSKSKDKKGKAIYPSRLRFMIEDLLKMKSNGWKKKIFKAVAKTMDEIKADALKDEKVSRVDGSEIVIAGQRPAWMTGGGKEAKAGVKGEEADGDWLDVPKKKGR